MKKVKLLLAVVAAAAFTAAIPPAAQAARLPTAAHKSVSQEHRPPGALITRLLIHRPELGRAQQADSRNNYWAGYAATANGANKFDMAFSYMLVPTVTCSKSIIGADDYALTADWAGIDGYGNDYIEQTVLLTWCYGTPGDYGSGSPGYGIGWFTLGPSGNSGFQYFSDVGTLDPGDSLELNVFWDPAEGPAGEFWLYWNDATQSTAGGVYEPCYGGSTCPRATAEVIDENVDGGAPQRIAWLAKYQDFSSILIGVTGGDFVGFNQGGSAWTVNGPFEQDYCDAYTPEYPYLQDTVHDTLNADGTAFSVGTQDITSDCS
jgi:hypothetical protein